MSFIMFSTRLSLFVTVLHYVLMDKHITAEKVFMLTAYYNILRQNMTVFFPQGKILLVTKLKIVFSRDFAKLI